MTSRVRFFQTAILIFFSGFCALVYQTTWLREFRLIFGASTAAMAAVLAIFMGGLGIGSAVLGRRSESKIHPLRFYAKLELFIAASASITPLLLWLIRQAYLGLGGTLTMGLGLGTVVRLIMSALALAVPTFLMGGTLPAVARVVTHLEDVNRRSLALLYGVNALGAVAGVFVATFYLFEAVGNHLTLVIAVACNLAVALAAYQIDKTLPSLTEGEIKSEPDSLTSSSRLQSSFVLTASASIGFAFFLMELVWYRMLSPLLGGSTFTFGLILAVALLGIGIGGVLYGFLFGNRPVTWHDFALVCGLESLFIAIPFALGDRIALTTMLLRPLGALGFYGHVAAWTTICAVVALPAAILSGIQFPALISLMGKGQPRVGVQTGTVYAWNTAGAIIGSLAGGFGLLPLLSAPGVWKLVIVLLCLLAVSALALSVRHKSTNYVQAAGILAIVTLALCCLSALGPTAFWRHSQIGVGRLTKFSGPKSAYHELENQIRRDILWDVDGLESSVALSYSHGVNFIVNGRCDGHSVGDSGTQIMSGLIPAALHPNPKRALVVGLGTGSTAGWLGALSSMERVDVVELEPAIVRVAQACSAVNHQALNNPKVHVIIGDGREALLATHKMYDVIASEPSNPYRAGIASLFTREYYLAVAGRLNPGGLFAQWMQAYEVDTPTVATVYATLGSVFPNIQTWQTAGGDMLFVAALEPFEKDAEDLRQRLAQEPFRSAMLYTWGTTSLEAFIGHFIADNSLAHAMQLSKAARLNTDDHTILEFAFARNVATDDAFSLSDLRTGAKISGADHFPLFGGHLDQKEVDHTRSGMENPFREITDQENSSDPQQRSRLMAYARYIKGDLEGAMRYWSEAPRETNDLNDETMVAECLAEQGNPETISHIEKIREYLPVDADAIMARYLFRRGELENATDLLVKVFQELREYPWQDEDLTTRTLVIAQKIAQYSQSESLRLRLYQALRTPFSIFNSEEIRRMSLFHIGAHLDGMHYGDYSLPGIAATEPYVPWSEKFLKARKECYAATGSNRLGQAERDLRRFLSEQPDRLETISFIKEIPPDPSETGFATEVPKH